MVHALLDLALVEGGHAIQYNYDRSQERTGINALLEALTSSGVAFRDLETSQSSLEDIFVDLLRDQS